MTVEQFRSAFRERVLISRTGGQELVEAPGLVALVGTSAEALDGRVLVTDDRSADTLHDLVPDLHARVANVFDAAPRAHALLAATGRYRTEHCTAMVCPDLAEVPRASLPDGLELRRVQRLDDDPAGPGGVRLVHAAAVALRSDAQMAPVTRLDDFVAYLRSVPGAVYLAAVDADGLVRATAASSVFGSLAGVFFVNTDPAWRGRGVGTAMTAAALHEAARAGATGAFLDSSAIGRSIYLRLGFEPVAETTLFISES
ncbi:MAG: GNAT family N-acetyltransferase [Actinomycetes bacterium]